MWSVRGPSPASATRIPFLTIAAGDICVCGDGGMIGPAFHPNAVNGRFFVHVTAASSPGCFLREPDRRVPRHAGVRYRRSQPGAQDPEPRPAAGQPQRWGYQLRHRQLPVHPVRDGGKQGDPDDNAQSTFNWLGAVLRIDIDGGVPNAIPAGNRTTVATGRGRSGPPGSAARGARRSTRSPATCTSATLGRTPGRPRLDPPASPGSTTGGISARATRVTTLPQGARRRASPHRCWCIRTWGRRR